MKRAARAGEKCSGGGTGVHVLRPEQRAERNAASLAAIGFCGGTSKRNKPERSACSTSPRVEQREQAEQRRGETMSGESPLFVKTWPSANSRRR